ncbi:hypothetical protein BFJ63_vAg16789 [Fusarium oxysporum f. sp. narcissi]|uniref:Uncharacterized protein n=2 Tax=Fusarium oxysporum TaxID=5507 RepID=A0A420ND12_FUSOX|nr:hypothetical protein BFJ69_g16217 [Fusarium oxysporum]RKK78158.1 hypothetical protein BFJ71_g16555 [Fusarium oxysporum]RKK87007.1 hypothetical protein BFJ68_g17079 [Fusarium oxysporum]RYC80332.1 hypothetical protein BFJ63_vAg16789 [Fusarium oxysporum f. sp. narcissi]
MTSELSAISPSISAGIATTSETSTTSAASTQGVLPTVYTANPNIGPGGQIHNESKHFRVYGTIPVNVNRTHDLLEGEYDCLSIHGAGDHRPCPTTLKATRVLGERPIFIISEIMRARRVFSSPAPNMALLI